jgi:CHAD domain-containing protein
MMYITRSVQLWLAARTLLAERADDFFRRWGKAQKTFDPEDIHDLRVASRRLREGLALFKPCFPAKSLSRSRDQVKKLTNLLGIMRNTDEAIVFLSALTAEELQGADQSVRNLLAELAGERETERKKLKQGLKSLQRGSFRTTFSAVCNKTFIFQKCSVDPFMAIADFAGNEIMLRTAAIKELLPQARVKTDISAQHRLRIAVKRFRYRLEIIAPLLTHGYEELHCVVKNYQEVLGKLHDLDVFTELVTSRIGEAAHRQIILAVIAARRHGLYASFLAMLDKEPMELLGERARSAL